ncbi:unnamed protein product [Parnassius apollo]|uniref:(apollo) hypothetical protein n=1 Tax=Parnassius apollo TaxID=110799 RepID=A0A8S3WGU8_PARAO|nr:unnamed protein product [Parnassius apollo]
MDKEENTNLDVEYKRYLQILKPYLEQLLDQEDIQLCNAWIQRLSDCKAEEKIVRNKYLFMLCFQLAKGVLSEPFNDHPPSNELPVLLEEESSEDSFSELDCPVRNSENNNTEIFSNNSKSLADTAFQSNNSGITVCSSKVVTNLTEPNQEMQDIKALTENLLFSSNSTLANYLCLPEIFKDLSNITDSEDDVYSRVNKLVEKLREIKNQNAMLRNELQILKEGYKIEKDISSGLQRDVLQIHCATNTTISVCNSDSQTNYVNCNCKTMVAELKEKLDNFNELKILEIEKLKYEHESDVLRAKTSIREEIQNHYERKLHNIKEEYELKIKETSNKHEAEIRQLKTIHDEILIEKENAIALKNKEIANLRADLEEIKAHNSILRNSFVKNSTDFTSETFKEKAQELERRLYKTEKSKSKHAKVYQIQIASIQREKNLLESTLHLQLLKQRTELITELTEENQKELTNTMEKLEEKYKEIVANVQAAAIQRRMQDQKALETIIQTLYRNRLSRSATYTAGEKFNSKPIKIQNDKRDEFHLFKCCNRETFDDKNVQVANLEDSLLTGFCLDEAKLEELFERVHIPQRDTGEDPLNS